MAKNHTLISLSLITKADLDNLKKEYGNISYDKIITTLIVELYKNKKNKNE